MALHRLKREYTIFVQEFAKWAESAGATVQMPEKRPIIATDLGNGITEIRTLLHLEDWPYKAGTRKSSRGLSMLIRTKEIYEKTNKLIKSNVNALYFKPTKQGEPVSPDIAIHYDYQYQMEAAHPVFHAQFGALEISAEELEEVAFSRPLDLAKYNPIKSIRIPTVHVGLPATLLALAADHLNKDAYYGFLDYASKQPFFNGAIDVRLDRCREQKLHAQDPWVYRSHNIYM